MPCVTCLHQSDVSVICHVTYFQFPIQSAFLHIGHQAAPALRCIGLIRNIRHQTLPKVWVGTYLVRNVQFRGKTELILTVKMESRHHVEGQLVVNFQRSVIIVELWRPKVARR